MLHLNQLKGLPLNPSKKSPTGLRKKPEYLIARSQLRGPWVRSHSIFDGIQAKLQRTSTWTLNSQVVLTGKAGLQDSASLSTCFGTFPATVEVATHSFLFVHLSLLKRKLPKVKRLRGILQLMSACPIILSFQECTFGTCEATSLWQLYISITQSLGIFLLPWRSISSMCLRPVTGRVLSEYQSCLIYDMRSNIYHPPSFFPSQLAKRPSMHPSAEITIGFPSFVAHMALMLILTNFLGSSWSYPFLRRWDEDDLL